MFTFMQKFNLESANEDLMTQAFTRIAKLRRHLSKFSHSLINVLKKKSQKAETNATLTFEKIFQTWLEFSLSKIDFLRNYCK